MRPIRRHFRAGSSAFDGGWTSTLGPALLVGSLWLTLAAPAHAQNDASATSESTATVSETDKEQARRLIALGDERFAAGQYQGALDAYRGAELVMAVPTTTLQVARAQMALGQLLEARVSLRRLLSQPVAADEPRAFTAARREATRLSAELARRTPSLAVELRHLSPQARAWLTVNGVSWTRKRLATPQKMNPGDYQIVVWVDGAAMLKRSVRLREGDREVVRIDVPPPTEDERTGPSPLVYVGFGIAGAALVVGTVTGALSLVRAAEVKEACFSDDLCPRSVEPLQNESVALAHVSTASFAIAGAGAVMGLVALIGQPEPTTGQRGARLVLSPGGAAVRASF
jgi:hypothetical protein